MKTITAEKQGTRIISHRRPGAAIYLASRYRKEGFIVRVTEMEVTK